MCEHIFNSTPKARKKHICDFCGDTIEKGTKYNRDVFKDDYIFTWKSHFSCDKLVKKMNMNEESNYEGVSEEFFRYFVSSYYDDMHNSKKDILFLEKLKFTKKQLNIK